MVVRARRSARYLDKARRSRRGGPAASALAAILLAAILLAAALLAAGPVPAGAAPVRPASATEPPPGYRLSANGAVAAAERSPRVLAETRRHRGLAPTAYTDGRDLWQVSFFRDRDELVQVELDDRSGAVLEVWTGPQVQWEMARGYAGAFGRKATAPYVWIPLCVLFLAPFVDPRRPFRLLHLDLLVLLVLSISHAFFNRGLIFASVPLVYPVLLYLLARALVAGFRPRRRVGQLVPLVPAWGLVLGLLFLVAFRVALNLADSNVIDVGYAGVIGADLIGDGEPLYEGNFPKDNAHGDTYGPAAYLLYVPFEQILPWSGRWDGLGAAHAAALVFDGLTLGGLFLLGRRLRPGSAGRLLGLALAFAWAAYPYTLFALSSNTNDSLVAAFAVLALLCASSPVARGALVAVAGLAKFAPLALAPLLAAGTGERRGRSILAFGIAFALMSVALVAPFVPDDGLSELYSRTLGNQIARNSPFSVWGQYPWLEPLQRATQVAAVALGLVVAFLPRRRTVAQLAGLGAAVLILLQIGTTHWFYLYVVWFAPLLLVALLGEHGTGSGSHRTAEEGPGRRADEPALAAP